MGRGDDKQMVLNGKSKLGWTKELNQVPVLTLFDIPVLGPAKTLQYEYYSGVAFNTARKSIGTFSHENKNVSIFYFLEITESPKSEIQGGEIKPGQ